VAKLRLRLVAPRAPRQAAEFLRQRRQPLPVRPVANDRQLEVGLAVRYQATVQVAMITEWL
jgi:hypothetical protein